MKIVHLSTSDSGGAGIAAVRLHKNMLRKGHDSNFITLHKKTDNSSIIKYSDSFWRKIFRASRGPWCEYIQNQKKLKSKTGEFESFSFITSDYRPENHPLVRSADIINLHLVNGFIHFPSFFHQMNKPVFWTLHDMNPFQGGFHYENDVLHNQPVFGLLEKELINQKKTYYSDQNNLNIIALNHWMCRKSSNSELLGHYRHFIIPNSIDTEVFRPADDKIYWRKKFNLPTHQPVLLFSSFDLKNYRKGGDLLAEAISRIIHKNVTFCVLGKSGLFGDQPDFINIGFIGDERSIAGLYSCVDSVIIPSREDNLPNVMMEALACGTPVVATPVGGIPDVVKTGINGILANNVSAEELAAAIDQFLDCSFNREKIRMNYLENYSEDILIPKYIDAYFSALKQPESA